jgi:hypothetical protein
VQRLHGCARAPVDEEGATHKRIVAQVENLERWIRVALRGMMTKA